jgi:hypothetical protein
VKRVIFCVGMLGLTIALSAQQRIPPRESVKVASDVVDGVLKAREIAIGGKATTHQEGVSLGGRRVARDVQIRIDSTVLTADEVEITPGRSGGPDTYELRGAVRLTARLKIE